MTLDGTLHADLAALAAGVAISPQTPDGRIARASVDADYRTRRDPADVPASLRELAGAGAHA